MNFLYMICSGRWSTVVHSVPLLNVYTVLSKTIMRVTDIDYAGLEDGTISIEAIEDVFSFDKTEIGRAHV